MKAFLALALCVAVAQATSVPVRRYKPNKWNLTPPIVTKERIVGGWDANIEEHPYQLSLQWLGFHICGASIISTTWAMSAAHCFLDDDLPSDFQMRGGSSLRSSGGILFGMAEFVLHPNYDDWSLDFDAAVMRGTGNFVGANVAPIPLIASGTAVPAGWDAVVSGWGLTATGGNLPERLQAVNKPTWLREPCDQIWGPGEITENKLCAGGVQGQDSCNGDSGGPLTYGSPRQQIGIVSWGSTNCGDPVPAVYVNVASPAIHSFITQHATDI